MKVLLWDRGLFRRASAVDLAIPWERPGISRRIADSGLSARRGTITAVTLVFTLLTLAVLGLVVAVALGWIGGGLDAPASSLPEIGLPEGEVDPADLDHLRFAPALRGYRMDQVDQTLDRLAGELARRDAEIAHLRELAEADRPTELESFLPPEG
jgi:DivIVA domain-containing protein